jgi:hypothetical protein
MQLWFSSINVPLAFFQLNLYQTLPSRYIFFEKYYLPPFKDSFILRNFVDYAFFE